MKLHTMFIGIVLFLLSNGLQAQEQKRIENLFSRNFRPSRDVPCQSFYGTVMLSYSAQSATPVITFSYNWKEPMIKEFNRVMPHFTSAKWEEIFPAIGKNKNFNILLPLMVSTMESCDEKIPAHEVLAMMEKSISVSGKKPVFIFTLPPLAVGKPSH